MGQVLNGVLKGLVIKATKAASLEQITELKVTLDFLLKLALEDLFERWYTGRDVFHRLLVKQILHRHAIKYLPYYDLLVELCGAERDQITRLPIHCILLVPDLHNWRFILNVRLVLHITCAYHLVDENWVWL